jgi:hypothetical protein
MNDPVETGFKCWYQSRAMWGGLVALGGGIAGLYGYNITPEDQKTLIELLTALSAAIGGVVAIVGRIRAKHPIGPQDPEAIDGSG